MSENPIGMCCSIALVACLDVCTGVCLDFFSIRRSCPENFASCCRRTGAGQEDEDQDEAEREPLLTTEAVGDQPTKTGEMIAAEG
ncbi:hypothetical protein OF83DRAFT_1097768 [Amylostereum chailletii]|nr:hypothetical protein OF83DRAFT_1097768 [Amylostereum chailletii]